MSKIKVAAPEASVDAAIPTSRPEKSSSLKLELEKSELHMICHMTSTFSKGVSQ